MTLKELRQTKGLTLKALGAASGVHPVKISQYESGTLNIENMSLKNAARLADALGCDPRDFLKEG
ncbi:MAG: helix-turn-helix transcriptional regulator [Eubacterium sp.]|nr:helix-turn-helix transcriptional regulator [Candidatus Colimonas fimequi]